MRNNTVDMKHLIYKMLLSWRMILISMLVFAVLLDGLGYVKKSRDAEKASQSIGQESEKQVEFDEVAHAAIAYKTYEENYKIMQDYLDHSVRMQIDPQHVSTMTVQYVVDNHYQVEYPVINKKDNTKDILNALAVIVKSDETCKSAAADMDAVYISELIEVIVAESDVLTINVIGRDQAECEMIMNAVQNSLNNSADKLAERHGTFDLKKSESRFSEKISIDLLTERQNRVNFLDTISKSMNTIISNLKEDQKDSFYEYLADDSIMEAGKEEISEQTQVQEPAKKVPVIMPKFILIGLAFGAAFACFCIGCLYILSGRLHSEEDITEIYGLPLLGTIYHAAEQKKFGSFIDRWLMKQMDSRKDLFTTEERIRMAAAGIRIAAEKEQMKKLYITGTICDKSGVENCENLKKALSSELAAVESGKSILLDPDSMLQMAEADGVVLVEYSEMSLMKEIEEEIAVCIRSKVPVLGVVIVKEA